MNITESKSNDNENNSDSTESISDDKEYESCDTEIDCSSTENVSYGTKNKHDSTENDCDSNPETIAIVLNSSTNTTTNRIRPIEPNKRFKDGQPCFTISIPLLRQQSM